MDEILKFLIRSVLKANSRFYVNNNVIYIDCLYWPLIPLYGNAWNANLQHERAALFPLQGVDFVSMPGRAGWLLGAFVWPPIKLSYLLIMTEIRTRPLTTYGNTRTNVRGTWSSLTDYVPCTPASNLVLSHVISFQIRYLGILKRNTEVSTNFHLNLFIFYLLIKHVTVVHTCHS